jgi:hypothetical protein
MKRNAPLNRMQLNSAHLSNPRPLWAAQPCRIGRVVGGMRRRQVPRVLCDLAGDPPLWSGYRDSVPTPQFMRSWPHLQVTRAGAPLTMPRAQVRA